jgi:hypothetical protein
MSKPRDAAKERYWRGVIRRHAASGLGTRRFCRKEGIAEDRYHWWRRTLRERDRQAQVDAKSGRTRPSAATGARREEDGAFLPVRLPFCVAPAIEVVHPRGCVVRVPAGFDVNELRRLFSALDACDAVVRESGR